ncbi:MAG: Gfo/Idh/MocA family oxidoreductase [Xanthomonadales bacterium]|nr:Gfo/Idh/MocA family oxidoreductase [Xanthomonadales bacterium]NIX13805.1 Gfo/Idh/MocA family oxidoreductase [Xanthomonadales bacterium]
MSKDPKSTDPKSTGKAGTTRREFIKRSTMTATGLAAGLGSLNASVFARAPGANDRIRVGFIGLGNRGSQLMQRFMANDDVEVAALCDVYEPYVLRDRSLVNERWIASGKAPKMGETFRAPPKRFADYRELLEQDDIDAVCIATPDHWHALQTIDALAAGKDIYVEKPLTITLREGRTMVEAEACTDRIVAVGLNRRGSSVYRELADRVRDGVIGDVRTAHCYRVSNMFPDGIGALEPEDPPPGFDWDAWLGPRAFRPYQYNIAPYYFRWWSDYSSQMGNWGVHYMDVIRWMVGEQAPVAVSAHGSKLLGDDKTIPDTMEVTFEFASGMLAQFHIYEACGATGVAGGEIEFGGTHGNLVTDQNGYRVSPVKPGQFQTWERLLEPEEKAVGGDAAHGDLAIREDSTANLIRNFLDCVRTREQPLCTLEDGHRSTSFAHLANIAMATGTRIEWDASAERITNNEAANDLLHYEYREPWSLD